MLALRMSVGVIWVLQRIAGIVREKTKTLLIKDNDGQDSWGLKCRNHDPFRRAKGPRAR